MHKQEEKKEPKTEPVMADRFKGGVKEIWMVPGSWKRSGWWGRKSNNGKPHFDANKVLDHLLYTHATCIQSFLMSYEGGNWRD